MYGFIHLYKKLKIIGIKRVLGLIKGGLITNEI